MLVSLTRAWILLACKLVAYKKRVYRTGVPCYRTLASKSQVVGMNDQIYSWGKVLRKYCLGLAFVVWSGCGYHRGNYLQLDLLIVTWNYSCNASLICSDIVLINKWIPNFIFLLFFPKKSPKIHNIFGDFQI